MARLTAIILGLQLLLLTQITIAAPQTVADLGESSRFQITGNETFSDSQIRSELGANLDVLLACHPDASRDDLLKLLQVRVLDGYRHAGFAKATVAVRLAESQSAIVITIHEGPRFRSSGIEIAGTATLSADRLQTLLTSSRLESAAPIKFSQILWKVGSPASFAAGYWESKHEEMNRHFEFLGYHDVQFTVEPRAEADGTATLVVTIQDEGSQAVLGEIEVLGTEKNSAEDVIRYLDLPPGSVLDATVKSQIEQKLSNSARFLKHEVKFIGPFGSGPSTLQIKLVEYPEAPALSQPLSAKEEAAIRLAHWINHFESTGHDFDGEFTYPLDSKLKFDEEPPQGALIAHFRLVISHSHQSCLLRLRLFEHHGREWFDLWGQMSPQTMEILSPRHGLKYQARGLSQSVVASIQWTTHPPDKNGRMSNLQFGVGVKSNLEHRRPPFTLQAIAAPAAALRESHLEHWQLHNGSLMVDNEQYRVEIDANTGRLVRLEAAHGPVRRITIRCAPDRHQQMVDEYEQLAREARVVEAGDVPLSNLLTFLATCIPERSSPSDERRVTRLVTVLHSLLKRGAFHAFDELVFEFCNPANDRFWIPPESLPRNKKRPPASWTAMVLPYVNKILPTQAWPRSLIREIVFVLSGRTSRTEQSIQAMLSDSRSGPLNNLASAHAFGLFNPKLRIEFARRGLTRLQRERFLWDCEPFLQDGTPIGRLLRAFAQTLQDVEDHEIHELVSELPVAESERQSLTRSLHQFSVHRSDHPMEALRAAIDDAWEPLIEPYLRVLLETLAQ
ncbi:MAG: hypothetical protein JSS49_06145 [Planctomycetes bacterium]|nr:hypothetical protein [Planctomycetota bacterium]